MLFWGLNMHYFRNSFCIGIIDNVKKAESDCCIHIISSWEVPKHVPEILRHLGTKDTSSFLSLELAFSLQSLPHLFDNRKVPYSVRPVVMIWWVSGKPHVKRKSINLLHPLHFQQTLWGGGNNSCSSKVVKTKCDGLWRARGSCSRSAHTPSLGPRTATRIGWATTEEVSEFC